MSYLLTYRHTKYLGGLSALATDLVSHIYCKAHVHMRISGYWYICVLSLLSNAGCSRSVTIALAYVIQEEKISLKEALTRLRQTRPPARPNDGFMRQLEQWERFMKHFSFDSILHKIRSQNNSFDEI